MPRFYSSTLPTDPVAVEALAAEGPDRYWERWNEENKEAVAAYNERIEHEGLPLAKYRTFMKEHRFHARSARNL